MDFLAKFRKLLAAMCLVLCALSLPARSESAAEPKVKAAFIYNFAKFVKWPAAAFTASSDPVVVCTVGSSQLQDALEETIKDKRVDAHPLVLRHLKTGSDARGCHLLVIPGSELPRVAPVLGSQSYQGVLTVSEVPARNDQYVNAAIITFVPDSTRIRFAISSKNAEKAGVEISSKLLSLAVSVEQ